MRRVLWAKPGEGHWGLAINAEKSKSHQTGKADLPTVDEAGAGAGPMAMPEVRRARESPGSSQDQAEPAGGWLARKSGNLVRPLPHGRARAAELHASCRQSMQQAKAAAEVKPRSA